MFSFQILILLVLLKIVSSKWKISVGTDFEFTGTGDRPEMLPRLESNGFCNLTTFKLSFAHVHRQVLVDFLKDCHYLKSISLKNVTWDFKKGSNTEKIHLPYLQAFEFELIRKSSFEGPTDLESVVFFHKNFINASGGLTALEDLNFQISVNVSGGHLKFSRDTLEAISIKDQKIWTLLFDVWFGFRKFTANYCILDVSHLNMEFMKEIYLDNNEFLNGNVAGILKTAKVAQTLKLNVLKDEAIDMTLLPSRTLHSISTWRISLRWSSAQRPIYFPNLAMLNMTFGDIDLNLFELEGRFNYLGLDHMYLWNSSVEDIQRKMPKLTTLLIGCQFFKGICPTVTLNFLPKSVETLVLSNVDVKVGRIEDARFPNLIALLLSDCRLHGIQLNLKYIFPAITAIVLTIDDILEKNFLQEILHTRIQGLGVTVRLDKPLSKRVQFQKLAKTYLNVSIPQVIYQGGKSVRFRKVENGWSVDTIDFQIHQLLRFLKLLRLLGYSTHDITQTGLDVVYYSYTTFVYVLCAAGLLCNSLSIAVLLRRTMRSSTSFIMLGLAICDSIYLLTSLVTVEEFQLLFRYVFERSALNGHFAYPLNQTAYTGSVYMTILITVERFVAICFPFKSSSIFTISRTIRYVLGVAVFSVALNIPRWFEFIRWNYAAESPYWSSNFPRQLHKFPAYENVYQKGLWYFFVFVTPLAAIALLNLFIWIRSQKAGEKRRLLGSSKAPENSLTKILLVIVLVFFICNALSAILHWLFISKNVEPEVAETFASLPIILNSAINFLLYYLMGTKFRTEFKILAQSALENCICKKVFKAKTDPPRSQEIRLSEAQSGPASASP